MSKRILVVAAEDKAKDATFDMRVLRARKNRKGVATWTIRDGEYSVVARNVVGLKVAIGEALNACTYHKRVVVQATDAEILEAWGNND